jgi:hypothetical protein
MGFAEPPALWALWRALAGVASAWVLVHVSAYCLSRRAHAGVVYSGVGAGMVLAGLVCLAFAALGGEASAAWIVLGLVALAAVPATWSVATTSGRRAGAAPLWPHARLIACYGAFGFGYIVPATFIPTMARSFIADPLVFGWAWPAFGAAALLSTLAASPLLKFGARRVWAIAQALMAVGVAAPLLMPSVTGVLLGALLVGGTFMVITMAGMREASRVAAEPARLMAAMTAAFAAGQIAGPLLVARWPMQTALAVAAFLLAVSAIALMKRSHVDERAPATA